LSLWWGVTPVVADLSDDLNDIVAGTVLRLRGEGRLPTPATVVVVNGSPDLEQSGANFVRLRRV
jgi:pyruvate kinase